MVLWKMLRTLSTPGEQSSWYGWGANQGTHILLGMWGASLFLWTAPYAPILVALFYLVVKEGGDYFLRGGSLKDGLVDSVFFGCGALSQMILPVSLFWNPVVLTGLVLLVAIGSLLRARKEYRKF